jgi:hypothetical protein
VAAHITSNHQPDEQLQPPAPPQKLCQNEAISENDSVGTISPTKQYNISLLTNTNYKPRPPTGAATPWGLRSTNTQLYEQIDFMQSHINKQQGTIHAQQIQFDTY